MPLMLLRLLHHHVHLPGTAKVVKVIPKHCCASAKSCMQCSRL
jgi:hypothetical protein